MTWFDLAAAGQLKCYNFCRCVFPKTTNSHFKPKPGLSQGYEEVEEISEVCESSVGNQCKPGEILAGGIIVNHFCLRTATEEMCFKQNLMVRSSRHEGVMKVCRSGVSYLLLQIAFKINDQL